MKGLKRWLARRNAQIAGQIRLWITINQKYTLAFFNQSDTQIHHCSGFPYSALLVSDRNNGCCS